MKLLLKFNQSNLWFWGSGGNGLTKCLNKKARKRAKRKIFFGKTDSKLTFNLPLSVKTALLALLFYLLFLPII